MLPVGLATVNAGREPLLVGGRLAIFPGGLLLAALKPAGWIRDRKYF